MSTTYWHEVNKCRKAGVVRVYLLLWVVCVCVKGIEQELHNLKVSHLPAPQPTAFFPPSIHNFCWPYNTTPCCSLTHPQTHDSHTQTLQFLASKVCYQRQSPVFFSGFLIPGAPWKKTATEWSLYEGRPGAGLRWFTLRRSLHWASVHSFAVHNYVMLKGYTI